MGSKKIKEEAVLPFVDKEAELNLIIFKLLDAKGALTSYEAYQILHVTKDYRGKKYSVIDNRMKALHKTEWLIQVGTKKNRPHLVESEIYALSKNAKTALEMKLAGGFNRFLVEANDELQDKMRELIVEFQKQKKDEKR